MNNYKYMIGEFSKRSRFLSVATALMFSFLSVHGQTTVSASKSGDQANLASTTVVLSEIYGGGGNAGSTYTHDFIELHNRGTAAVDLTGWSVQYASATGSTWSVTNLTAVMLQPGKRYLVQEAQGAGGTTPLPTPDATGVIAMSATAGKVALLNTTTALTGTCPTGAQIIDFVGYGATANCFEGTGPTPAPSNTTSAIRISPDTDSNPNDFVTGFPNPFNVTAANASLQGRVVTASGRGVGMVTVTLAGSTGSPRSALTNPFGYFTFEGVETGQTYFVSAQSKQYQFTQPTQTITVQDDLTGIVFEVQP